jgi:hypothetical protein
MGPSRIFHNLLTVAFPVAPSQGLSVNADAVAGLMARSEPVDPAPAHNSTEGNAEFSFKLTVPVVCNKPLFLMRVASGKWIATGTKPATGSISNTRAGSSRQESEAAPASLDRPRLVISTVTWRSCEPAEGSRKSERLGLRPNRRLLKVFGAAACEAGPRTTSRR